MTTEEQADRLDGMLENIKGLIKFADEVEEIFSKGEESVGLYKGKRVYTKKGITVTPKNVKKVISDTKKSLGSFNVKHECCGSKQAKQMADTIRSLVVHQGSARMARRGR